MSRPQNNDELNTMKAVIDFPVVAESYGYRLRGDKSTRKDKVMLSPSGVKIVVSRSANGHWIYFSTADHSDKGSVIDFVQRHNNNCSLGEARKLLRPYLSGSSTSYTQAVERAEKDFLPVWQGLQLVPSQYLIGRGITVETQSDPLFQARIRTDQRGNASFPLNGKSGLVGIARFNEGWKGIDEGSKRGIWTSNLLPFPIAQVQVVITESPVDSLSWQQLQRGGRYYHIATCGSLSKPQIEIIQYCIEVIGANSRGKTPVVLSAFDNDAAGDRYHRQLVAAGIETEQILPPSDKDWNEFLRLNF